MRIANDDISMLRVFDKVFDVTGGLATVRGGGVLDRDWRAFQIALDLATRLRGARYYYYRCLAGENSLLLASADDDGARRVGLLHAGRSRAMSFVERWVLEQLSNGRTGASDKSGYRIHLSGEPAEICTIRVIGVRR